MHISMPGLKIVHCEGEQLQGKYGNISSFPRKIMTINNLIRSGSWKVSNSYHWIIENMSLSGSESKFLFHPIQPKPYVKVGIRGNLVLPILKTSKSNGQPVNSHIRISRETRRKDTYMYLCPSQKRSH